MIIYKNSFAQGRTIAHRCMPVNKIHGADVGRFFSIRRSPDIPKLPRNLTAGRLAHIAKSVSPAIHRVKEIVTVLDSLIPIALIETAPTIASNNPYFRSAFPITPLLQSPMSGGCRIILTAGTRFHVRPKQKAGR
jgi:hypothetical protein